MAELERSKRQTTIRPAPVVSASGFRAQADGYNRAARDLMGVAGDIERELEEERQLFEMTELSRLENDIWRTVGEVTRKNYGKPEMVQAEMDAYLGERMKALPTVLGRERSEKILPMWRERANAIAGRAVSAQHEVAFNFRRDDAKQSYLNLVTTMQSSLGAEIQRIARNGGTPNDVVALITESMGPVRESARGLLDQKIITPTQFRLSGLDLNKWGYKVLATEQAKAIYMRDGPDAAAAYIESLDGARLTYTPDELEKLRDLATIEASESDALGREERRIAAINYAAAVQTAETMDEISPPPAGLRGVELAQANANYIRAVARVEKKTEEEAVEKIVDGHNTAIVGALVYEDPSMLPSDEDIERLPAKEASALYELRERARLRISAKQLSDAETAQEKLAKAQRTAEVNQQISEWTEQLRNGDTTGVPTYEEAGNMHMRMEIDFGQMNRLQKAWIAATKADEKFVRASEILQDPNLTATTADDRAAINAAGDKMRLDPTNPEKHQMALSVVQNSGMVPNIVKDGFKKIGTIDAQTARAMAALGTKLAPYGLWDGQSKLQTLWATVSDMIELGLPDHEIKNVLVRAATPGSPVSAAEREANIAALATQRDLIPNAINDFWTRALDDGSIVSRVVKGVFGGEPPRFPVTSRTVENGNMVLSIGLQDVDVDPRLEEHVRVTAGILNASSDIPLRPEALTRAAVDTTSSRIGVSSVSRPVGETGYALTWAPPEVMWPNAVGAYEDVVAYVAKNSLMGMRDASRELSAPERNMYVEVETRTGRQRLSIGEVLKDKNLALPTMFQLIREKKLYVEPAGLAGDKMMYSLHLIDADGVPRQIEYRNTARQRVHAFGFDENLVMNAKRASRELGPMGTLRRTWGVISKTGGGATGQGIGAFN